MKIQSPLGSTTNNRIDLGYTSSPTHQIFFLPVFEEIGNFCPNLLIDILGIVFKKRRNKKQQCTISNDGTVSIKLNVIWHKDNFMLLN